MKKSVLFYAFTLLLSAVMFSCKPSDEKIQKEVETALATAQPEIASTVEHGVVILTGVVESEEAKSAAETIVKTLKDVKSVTNNIEVKVPVIVNPDKELTAIITTTLQDGGFKDVKVVVEDGVATLTGDVKKADLQKVMQIANEAKPTKVDNKLNIK